MHQRDETAGPEGWSWSTTDDGYSCVEHRCGHQIITDHGGAVDQTVVKMEAHQCTPARIRGGTARTAKATGAAAIAAPGGTDRPAPAGTRREYQEFYPSDCGNCWLMNPGTPNPFYCNKPHGCEE